METSGGYRFIELTLGCYALVSQSDYEELSRYRWHTNKIGNPRKPYARRSCGYNKPIPMANHIMNPPPGFVVDHINRHTLDNRRENLRVVTPQQNSLNVTLTRNSSGVRNVFKNRDGWIVSFRINKKQSKVKFFKDKNRAIEFRNNYAKTYLGEFDTETRTGGLG